MSLIPFQNNIISELKNSPQGGILMISKGLGLYSVIASYLSLFDDPINNLIYLLNFDNDELNCINDSLLEILTEQKKAQSKSQIFQITTETSQKRSQIYLQGGFYSVSNVILTFDLMQKTVTPSLITGIIINKIEKIKSIYDKEPFISTLIKLENQKAFIIGICEDNELLLSNFTLEGILKTFYLNKLFLWPSCRLEVQNDLLSNEKNCLEEKDISFKSIEKIIDLTPLMKKIQKKILKLIENVVNEINRIFRKNNNNENLFSKDQIFSQSFFFLNKQILKFSETIPQINNNVFVRDLKNLKNLLTDLINYDSCGFYKKILMVRENSSFDSIWFVAENKISELCEEIVELSKKRVYEIKEIESSIEISIPEREKKEEENKIESEKQIKLNENSQFNEINFDYNKNDIQTQINSDPIFLSIKERISLNNDISIVNIEKKEETIIENVIKQPSKYDFFLKHKLVINLEISPKLENLKNLLEFIISINPFENEKKPLIWIYTNQESRIKKINEFILSVFYKKDSYFTTMYKEFKWMLNSYKDRLKRYEIMDKIEAKNIEQREIAEYILLEKIYLELDDLFLRSQELSILSQNRNFENENEKHQFRSKLKNMMFENIKYNLIDINNFNLESSFEEYDTEGNIMIDFEKIFPNHKIMVNSLKKSSLRQLFLKNNKPTYVILYEPSMTLIRELLVHQKQNPGSIKNVYVFMFKNSVESAGYLGIVKRENYYFEQILKQRNELPLMTELPANRIKSIEKFQDQNRTRIGKGLGFIDNSIRPIIIVDKREFGSNLASKLFFEGFNVIPIMLDKGDYILTDEICIERKAVNTGDLLESLKGGRLEKQLKRMLESFKKCFLLIEFSQEEKFSFDAAKRLNFWDNQESNTNNVLTQQKEEITGLYNKGLKNTIYFMLCSIVIKFPKINIIWSKGHDHTAKIFKLLKKGKKEPDVSLYSKNQEDNEKDLIEIVENYLGNKNNEKENPNE